MVYASETRRGLTVAEFISGMRIGCDRPSSVRFSTGVGEYLSHDRFLEQKRYAKFGLPTLAVPSMPKELQTVKITDLRNIRRGSMESLSPASLRFPNIATWRFHSAAILIAFFILLAREPERLLNAQFWAEDGTVFYADAYNLGIFQSLFLPYAGYLCVTQRLAASLVQPFPLGWAPFLLNLIALMIQVLPVILLVSSRFAPLIPNLSHRLFLAFIYLGLPNTSEIHGNISNSQWYLALLACMVILAPPGNSGCWRWFDGGVIVLSALTGPFAILLIPVAMVYWQLRHNPWLAKLIVGLALGALIQGIAILFTAAEARSVEASETTVELFTKILAGQVFLGTLIGQNGYQKFFSPSPGYSLFAFLVARLGSLTLGYVLFKAPLELRMLVLYGALIFIASLVSATIPWKKLCEPGFSIRYWFIPGAAFAVSLVWLAGQRRPRRVRFAAIAALAVMFIGIVGDWQHSPPPDRNFQEYVAEFEQASPGTTVTIPVNPSGWFMYLVKH